MPLLNSLGVNGDAPATRRLPRQRNLVRNALRALTGLRSKINHAITSVERIPHTITDGLSRQVASDRLYHSSTGAPRHVRLVDAEAEHTPNPLSSFSASMAPPPNEAGQQARARGASVGVHVGAGARGRDCMLGLELGLRGGPCAGAIANVETRAGRSVGSGSASGARARVQAREWARAPSPNCQRARV